MPELKKDIVVTESQLLKWGGIALGTLVVGWILYLVVKKWVGRLKAYTNPELTPDGGEVSDFWERNEMPRIVSALESTLNETVVWDATDRCDLFGEVADLNDNQLRKVAATYTRKVGRNLRQSVKKITTTGCGTLGDVKSSLTFLIPIIGPSLGLGNQALSEDNHAKLLKRLDEAGIP